LHKRGTRQKGEDENGDDDFKDAREIVALGHIGYRNRTETTEPLAK
jgi:hypothetical protein